MMVAIIYFAIFFHFIVRTKLRVDLSIFLLTVFYLIYFIVNTVNWIILEIKTQAEQDTNSDMVIIISIFYILDNFILYFIQLSHTYFIFQMYFIKIIISGAIFE